MPPEPSQFGEIVGLWQRVGLTRPWNDPRADLLRALDGPTSEVLVGMDGDRSIVTVMVGYDGHRGRVYYLAVVPQARGLGHGRAIIAAAEAWLRKRRVPKLNLMVRSDNVAVDA